jgi:hypothetical protein
LDEHRTLNIEAQVGEFDRGLGDAAQHEASSLRSMKITRADLKSAVAELRLPEGTDEKLWTALETSYGQRPHFIV